MRIARYAPFLMLLAVFSARGDAGAVALGATTGEVAATFKPFGCRAVPEDSAYKICTYFVPPATHAHLSVEALNRYAGFPVNNTNFAFRDWTLAEVTVTFESRGTPGGRTIDPRELETAFAARFGPPKSRNCTSIGARGGIPMDETVWEVRDEKWVLQTYPGGGINVTLKRSRAAATPG